MRAAGPKRKQILAVLDDIVRGVEHLDRPVQAKLLPVLRAAHQELERDLKRWLAREAATGEARFTTQRYRNALIAVRQAAGTINRLGGATEEALWGGAQRAAHLATSHLIMEVEKFERIFEGTIRPVSIEVAGVIASGEKLLLKRFATSAQRYAGEVRESVVRELALSRVRGETMFELTNRLERELPYIFRGHRAGAARLARTETQHAYNVFHLEGLKQAKEDDEALVARWDASYDWRRCPMCASLDGQVADVAHGKKFEARWFSRSKRKGIREHVAYIEHPPGHPNCRCVVTAWHPSWERMARREEPESTPAERAVA